VGRCGAGPDQLRHLVPDPHGAGVAGRSGRMCRTGGRRSLRLQGERAMRNVRAMFVAYLVIIAVGLGYFITLGVLHQ
jgi:hypothetical protein